MNSIAIRTQLAAITRHLPGFSLDPECEYLIGAKGERLYLNRHNKRGMFTIGMGLPGSMDDFWSHYANPRMTRPDSISVSESKSPATIAADIKRRLFPPFYAVLAEAERRYQKEREECSREWDAAKRLSDALGGVRLHGKTRYSGGLPPEDRQHPAPFSSEEGVECEVQTASEGQVFVEIKFRGLPIDYAVELLRTARGFQFAQAA
jgi:hypothetical protein